VPPCWPQLAFEWSLPSRDLRRSEVEGGSRRSASKRWPPQQQSEERNSVRLSQQRLVDLIVILDSNGIVRYVSPSARRTSGGYSAGSLLRPETIWTSFMPDDRSAGQALGGRLSLQTSGSDAHNPNYGSPARQNGTWRDCEVIATNLLEQTSVQGLVLTCRDINRTQVLRTAADPCCVSRRHSPSLPNRARCSSTVLEHALARADRQFRSTAVLFVDLDHFKNRPNDKSGAMRRATCLLAVAAPSD